MDTKRLDAYQEFAKYIEYPMVIFEAESGKILLINQYAQKLLGNHISTIHLEPDRSFDKLEFEEVLRKKRSIIWHRIHLKTDEKEYMISGLVNEMLIENKKVYTVLFEMRADLHLGSLTLEKIVNNAGMVAIHVAKEGEEYHIEYTSRNIAQYGYTREKLFGGNVTLSDLFCAEDQESLRRIVYDGAKKHLNEISVEARLLTEDSDLIPVRLHIYYVYDANWIVTDFEILMYDLRQEHKQTKENKYLSNAISKIKSVVLVKSYCAGKRTLKYISTNAGMVGMNVDALKKGYKLTEDYIHPDDRDSVIDGIYQAVANGITDYAQTYRMVRDDGKQIWVENEVTVNRISDGEAEISFLLTDITEQKNLERELAIALESEEHNLGLSKKSSLSLITIDKNDKEMLKQFQLMAETLSRSADYYSVVLDAEGNLLTIPAGPSEKIGQFYDLFERPQYKVKFLQIVEKIKETMIPESVTFLLDNIEVHMMFAPLMLENVVTAYWVLTSFEEEGNLLLESVIDQQWRLANTIAQCFYAEEVVENETKLRKLTEMQLHNEQKQKQVIQDMIGIAIREGEKGLGQLCQQASVYLSFSDIGIYLENKETGNVERYFVWNRSGEEDLFFDKMELSVSEYAELKQEFKEKSVLIAKRNSEEPLLKGIIHQTDMEIVMLLKLRTTTGTEGYIVIADTEKNREFDEKDIRFAESAVHMFESIFTDNTPVVKTDMLREGFLEAYDHIRDAVFIKDKSGEIVFANKAMDKLYGYSLVGMQAGDIIYDELEHYRNMQAMRNRFIANKKVTKWQSYMKELDQIMNIVEVHLGSFTGSEYKLVILKRNKQK